MYILDDSGEEIHEGRSESDTLVVQNFIFIFFFAAKERTVSA